MNRQNFTGYIGRASLVGCIALALAGCQELAALTQKKNPDAVSAPAAPTKFIEKDVEAPQVFQKTEKALWDGRPSLGGVWVAHPDNKKPERVIIRNKSNGKFVIGALFNRDKSLPGPPFQLSSDAAAAIGAVAGTTIEISVTAMRVEKIAVEKPNAPKAAPSEDIAATPLKKLDDTQEPAKKAVKETKSATQKAAKTTKEAVKPVAKTAKEAVKPAVAKPAPAAPKKPATTGKYVQLGLFSVEANAKATLASLKAKGLDGKIVTSSSQGKTFHRVLAGPATTAAAEKKILSTVKSMGFTDAFIVKG